MENQLLSPLQIQDPADPVLPGCGGGWQGGNGPVSPGAVQHQGFLTKLPLLCFSPSLLVVLGLIWGLCEVFVSPCSSAGMS